MSDTPPAKKAKGESASPWAGLRQKLQAAPQTPVRMRGVGNSPAVASPSATTTEASAQLFFGESICVFAAEEARGLVCGAQVGNDMVCFNPNCPIETHKTGDRAFPDKSTGIFLRASAAPTKRFRVLREPIGNLDFFNRHNNILRRIQEYDPLKWQGVETILEQQPPVDSATLESQLREHTTLLNTLQLPDGEDYFLPKPQRRSPAPPSPEMGAPGGGTTSSGDEDITTDDELPDWPRALIAAEANLTRSTEEALEVSKYDDLLKGEFLETYEYRPHLNFSDLGKPYYKLSEEMLRLLKVQHMVWNLAIEGTWKKSTEIQNKSKVVSTKSGTDSGMSKLVRKHSGLVKVLHFGIGILDPSLITGDGNLRSKRIFVMGRSCG